MSSGPGLQMKLQRVVTFPNCMGLGESPKKKLCFAENLCCVGLGWLILDTYTLTSHLTQGLPKLGNIRGRLVTEVNNLPMVPCPTSDKLVCCTEDLSENDVFVW